MKKSDRLKLIVKRLNENYLLDKSTVNKFFNFLNKKDKAGLLNIMFGHLYLVKEFDISRSCACDVFAEWQGLQYGDKDWYKNVKKLPDFV